MFPFRFEIGETVVVEGRVFEHPRLRVQITHRVRVLGYPLYDIVRAGAVVQEDCPEYSGQHS